MDDEYEIKSKIQFFSDKLLAKIVDIETDLYLNEQTSYAKKVLKEKLEFAKLLQDELDEMFEDIIIRPEDD
jgi:hypothetical protein